MLWAAVLIGILGILGGFVMLVQAGRGRDSNVLTHPRLELDRATRTLIGVVLLVTGGAILYVVLGLSGFGAGLSFGRRVPV